LLFAYACGNPPSIRGSLDQLFSGPAVVAQSDLDLLYARHLGGATAHDQMSHYGSRVCDSVNLFTKSIETAAASAEHSRELLSEMNELLSAKADKSSIRKTVEGLVSAAQAMEAVNKRLQTELQHSRSAIANLQSDLETVKTESMLDALTRVANRKSFYFHLALAIEDARSDCHALSLLMIDVDHFKSFNDRFGHQTGDQVLQLVAHIIRQNVRGQDFAARYGGEEFAILLPQTPLGAAGLTVAKNLQKAVERKQLIRRSDGECLGAVTVSIGVACLRATDDAESLVARADEALYLAKRRGRNRVVTEADDELTAMFSTRAA
jgi:diguanylate cyclase